MRKLAAASAALALSVTLAVPAQAAAPPDPLKKVRDILGDVIICVTDPCP